MTTTTSFWSYLHNMFESICCHKDNVIRNAKVLCNVLMKDEANEKFCRELLILAYAHDNSKFTDDEWPWLTMPNSEKFQEAKKHHQETNDHHPEFFGGDLNKMSDLQIAHMAIDWLSRAQEQAKAADEWLEIKAKERFNLDKFPEVVKKIKYYTGLMIEKW